MKKLTLILLLAGMFSQAQDRVYYQPLGLEGENLTAHFSSNRTHFFIKETIWGYLHTLYLPIGSNDTYYTATQEFKDANTGYGKIEINYLSSIRTANSTVRSRRTPVEYTVTHLPSNWKTEIFYTHNARSGWVKWDTFTGNGVKKKTARWNARGATWVQYQARVYDNKNRLRQTRTKSQSYRH